MHARLAAVAAVGRHCGNFAAVARQLGKSVRYLKKWHGQFKAVAATATTSVEVAGHPRLQLL